ncbi:sodium:proton antiporter [Candidatus Finniella inopinata]|uniref:Sodium:proton antiporter n=1 Tax=Candidatus Finniella inopinata TaxID=1696036 RepID=A0A4Q7DP67_9PROT|nr:sodium:proton antiporter [Candidatus Finniella inopinata]RZI46756.1 sodium:proton antiporter [Candidatus Finniella inopinata]
MEASLTPPLWLGLPFIAVLVLMTAAPYAIPRLWHQFESKILFALAVSSMVGLGLVIGFSTAIHELAHVLIQDYVPFVILLSSLYVVTTGLHVDLKTKSTPFKNTAFLAIGSLLASVVGTTGASMILLRPFITMNSDRHYKTHSIIFFIFLVANIGGCLTPIGDPPLFLGYLNGVDFFWTLQTLAQPFMVTIAILLGCYFLLDSYFLGRETPALEHSKVPGNFGLTGKINLLLLLVLIGVIAGSGVCTRCYDDLPTILIMGQTVSLVQILTNASLIILACLSYLLTPKHIRHKQHFSWSPIREVTLLFAVIFVTIIPVNLMLQAGLSGPLHQVLSLTHGSSPALIYFWLTGLFSAFLDNAPTYLLFFKMAGGDAQNLMTSQAPLLMAISLGSVFMGAITYIGNAPNLMVRTLAKQSGIAMPGFLGYMVWSCVILLPLFLGVSLWMFF